MSIQYTVSLLCTKNGTLGSTFISYALSALGTHITFIFVEFDFPKLIAKRESTNTNRPFKPKNR